MISAIILAAGFSKRMGTNKLLLSFKDQRLIEFLLAHVSAYDFDERFLICNDPILLSFCEKYPFTVVPNTDAHLGQSASVKQGVRHAKKGNDLFFFVGDQPLLPTEVIETLIAVFDNADRKKIVLPIIHGNRKNPVLFPHCYRSEFLSLEGDVGGREIIRQHPSDVLEVPFHNDDFFLDVDTLEDYEYLQKKVSSPSEFPV